MLLFPSPSSPDLARGPLQGDHRSLNTPAKADTFDSERRRYGPIIIIPPPRTLTLSPCVSRTCRALAQQVIDERLAQKADPSPGQDDKASLT